MRDDCTIKDLVVETSKSTNQPVAVVDIIVNEFLNQVKRMSVLKTVYLSRFGKFTGIRKERNYYNKHTKSVLHSITYKVLFSPFKSFVNLVKLHKEVPDDKKSKSDNKSN